MKVALYFKEGDEYSIHKPNAMDVDYNPNFIGYVDLQILKPKKLVTKEADMVVRKYVLDRGCYHEGFVPIGAKNVKLTYEIEE